MRRLDSTPLPGGRAQSTRRSLPLAMLAAATLFSAPATAAAEAIEMRYPEGPAHGFVVVSDLGGRAIAHGELVQWLEKKIVASRLLIHFDDGSRYDETVRFSQHPRFRLQSYELVQKGPSFVEASEIRFDRSGHYSARVREAPDEEERQDAGTIDIPDDVTNGMTSILLKNLRSGASATTHLLSFGPEPRVLELRLSPEGSDTYWVGGRKRTATRFVMEPKVTGVEGVLATVVGKQPPSFHMWIAQGKAPVLLRFEGPLYADGPIWRIELGAPRWKP